MPRQPLTKSSLYRAEVTEAAVHAVLQAVARVADGQTPGPLDYTRADVVGFYQPPMRQHDRRIDWSTDPTSSIARSVRAADSSPGVLTTRPRPPDFAGHSLLGVWTGGLPIVRLLQRCDEHHACRRLQRAFLHARSRPTQVICLLGGRDFWSNGIDLNTIEAAENPARESWRNISAIDDLVRDILSATQIIVAGLRGNAGAGGSMLALAADRIYSRAGIILNPHYRIMGACTVPSTGPIPCRGGWVPNWDLGAENT